MYKRCVLPKKQTRERRLQSERDLTFNVYNSLARQLDQVRIKEPAPVFKTPQPVPIDDSSPFVRVLFSLLFMALN